ncbi:MAG: DNA-binding response regulator [Methylocella sp.]
MRLLVVEDDKDLNRQIFAALTRAGYAVDRAFDGEEGWFLGDTEPYDAVVLDLGLPKKDGTSVLSKWRRAGRAMPVLILTARDRWSDKVQGLLSYLMHHAGRIVSRSEIIEHLYDQDFDRDSNTIEVFVGRRRKKLGVEVIQTMRGLGYLVAAPETEDVAEPRRTDPAARS